MGFLSDFWDGACNICRGIGQMFSAIVGVIVETVFFVIGAVFSLVEHLFGWIGDAIDFLFGDDDVPDGTSTILLPPQMEEVQGVIGTLTANGNVSVSSQVFHRNKNKTIAAVVDPSGKVLRAQIVGGEKGFDSEMQTAFDKRNLYKIPVAN